MQNKLIAELYLPVPEPSHVTGRVALEAFEFSSDQEVFYKHEGVGSGEWFHILLVFLSILKTRPHLSFDYTKNLRIAIFLVILRKPELS